ISGESSSSFARSEAVRLKPGESRNHEENISAGSSTNLTAALCREWKNRSTPKRQFPRNLPARGRPARRKPPNPWENETIKANTVVLAITLLAEASSGEITKCLPYDEFNGPLRLAYLSLIRRSRLRPAIRS